MEDHCIGAQAVGLAGTRGVEGPEQCCGDGGQG